MPSASRRRAASALAAALLAALAFAAPARAGVLFYDGSDRALVFATSGNEAHDMRVARDGSALVITDELAPLRPGAGAPCAQGATEHAVTCDPAAIGLLFVVLGDEPDTFANATDVPSWVCSAGGGDEVIGGEGRDILEGGAGQDDLAGGGGNDVLAVGLDLPRPCPPGVDDGSPLETLDGGAGNDQIYGGRGADVLTGGPGDDIEIGFGGDDRIAGGDGGDTLNGLDGDDEVGGDGGDDLLFGGAGNDRVSGGDGDDSLGFSHRLDADGLGPSKAAVLAVETGNDVLDGGAGDDTLAAGPGDHVIDSVDPLQTASGGLVDRSLESPALNGADVYRGGPGDDVVTYLNRALPVRVTPDGVADDGSAGEGDNVAGDVERVRGGAAGDVLVARREGSGLFGDRGPDTLVGEAGPDTLSGGPEDDAVDTITGGGGDDDLGGGPGDDRLDGGPGRDAISGGPGSDMLAGGADADGLEGGAGADVLDGGAGDDCLAGFADDPAAGCRTAAGDPAGADGGDVLIGGPGTDRLAGGPGEDVADYSDARDPVLVALAGVAPERVARAGPFAERDVIGPDVEDARGGRGADVLLGDGADNLLDGGAGPDFLDGGGGADRLRGGPGRDLLTARDGAPDELRCGPDADIAAVDRGDSVVSLRADRCELVDGAGGRARRTRVLASPSCPVTVRAPGGRTATVDVALRVPWGTRLAPAACTARLRPPKHAPVDVAGGAFVLRRGVALGLVGGRACGSARRGERRRLSVRSNGRVTVAGAAARATGRRAQWTVIDRCDGTRVHVSHGGVRVRAGRRTVHVGAPRTYTVKAR